MIHENQVTTNENPSHDEVTISISCESIMEQLNLDVTRLKEILEVS